ncbi:hypothetical protein FSARC_13439 [Fusarium sarcochroum]|uniref:Uncharacterized protein n=1 Tax=Fusarium sarcochroum TaxID=1208366 RepID=A0A8H4T1M0_9HYPO|nr:hypothetical protein FSARC_13439 [Fusarium sarcochroum]
MHLDHKIPWKTIASHFTFVKSDTSDNYDLVALNSPSQTATLGHFSRVVSATIKEFSDTEISKVETSQGKGKLFSDDILSFPERYFGLGPHEGNSVLHNPLTASHQDLKYWQSRANEGDGTLHSTVNADLAEAVKMLVITAAVGDDKVLRLEALSALLRLSEHVPISDMRNLHWGHGFGVDLVAGVALEVYVLLNLIEAVQCRQQEQVSLLSIERLVQYLGGTALQNYDYPAQNIPHRAFWDTLGVTDMNAHALLETPDLSTERERPVIDPLASVDDEIHQKARQDLKKYLKDCFAILYVYDVFLRRAVSADEAVDFWSSEIDGIFRMLGCRSGDE